MRKQVWRRLLVVLPVGILTFALPGALPSHAAMLSVEQARSADGFVDSMGVNVHLHNNNSYGTPWDGTMEPLLVASGIRHVRDAAWMTNNDYYYQRLRTLAAAGIRIDYDTAYYLGCGTGSATGRVGSPSRLAITS